MAFPPFYESGRVGRLYPPDTATAIVTGQAAGLRPASEDARRILLLLVDAQVDFIHTDGALAVPGAVDDTRRTIEWLYRNSEAVTAVAASLDSHVPLQIFYPTWWANPQGQHPAPFTPISSEDVHQGRWRPLQAPDWSIAYVEKLEQQAKKVLMIWPYHTMIGTPGQAITPALYEAIAYHAGARQTQPTFLTKGSIPRTEHYSIVEPEVKVPEQPQGEINRAFLDMLKAYDLIYVAGQAKSHCVLETVTSILNYFADEPDVITRLRLLVDCMSSVAHPEIDFDALADATLAQYARQGVRLAQASDPIG